MTTYKSDAVNSGIMPDLALAGVVLCRTGFYENEAQDNIICGDTLQLVPIPKNAQILDIQIAVSKTGGTLDFAGATGCHVGDGSSPTRFMDDASLGTADVLNMATSTSKPGAVGYTYDEGNDTIDVAFTKAATVLETDALIMMNVFYKMAGSINDEDLSGYNAGES
jgi:hypothetical protein